MAFPQSPKNLAISSEPHTSLSPVHILIHKERHQLTDHINPQISTLSMRQLSMTASFRKHIPFIFLTKLVLFFLSSFHLPINRHPMNAWNICKYTFLDNLSEIYRCISTYIRCQIDVLASLFVYASLSTSVFSLVIAVILFSSIVSSSVIHPFSFTQSLLSAHIKVSLAHLHSYCYGNARKTTF